MQTSLERYKGINPGLFLENELKKRKIPKSRFALSIQEYPQTFGAITKGKRKLNLALALKIEHELNFEEGSLMMLQLFYDIQQLKLETQSTLKPDLNKFRKVLFWDTDIKKIHWIEQAEPIIKRVFERGNELEKKEIKSFYGEDKVKDILMKYNLHDE
jgi:plasmid maintenance system antidote protein VapI